MPAKWVRMRHEKTGGVTDVPAGAVEGYRARGWAPVDEADKPKSRTAKAADAKES